MSNPRDDPRTAVGADAVRSVPPVWAPFVPGAVCLVVIALYAWIASTELRQVGAVDPHNAYYNLLVDGFRAGQLNLKVTVPPGLRQLPDPYDPVARADFGLHDASYYHEKIYLYFGVTPALVLFWPFAVLTGQVLSHQQAVMIFCAVGFVASAGLLRALQRRFFPDASVTTLALGLFAVGLVNAVPVMLGRADVWEVPISCGYAFVMLALAALWCAFYAANSRAAWLATASLAYGLAVGARPPLLPGAVILLLPIAAAVREASASSRARWRTGLPLALAAVGPITMIGLGLLAYNYARFDSPWEFGQRYQLAGVKVSAQRLFSPAYFGYNLRVYFFAPLRWTREFPFAQGIRPPPAPPGHLGVDGAFGALANLPFLWFAGAVVLVWRNGRTAASALPLRPFALAVALLGGTAAATLCLFAGAVDRYEVEFLPAFALLAAIGLLAWERAAAPGAARRLLVGAAAVLLVISAGIDCLASFKSNPESQTMKGNTLARAGAFGAAAESYGQALHTDPEFAPAHHGLATVLFAEGRLPEAISHFRQALRAKPDFAEAHNGLGVALLRQREPIAALGEFEAALHAAPQFAEAQFNCAVALQQLNRPAEAIPHLEETLRLSPAFPGARERLDAARRQIQPH